MNTEDKIKVMQAFLEGEEIEARAGESDWHHIEDPSWNWASMEYRIKEKNYSLDIPWDLIKDKWRWAAMDGDGEIFLYTEMPSPATYGWVCPKGYYFNCHLKISKPDTKYWRRTLTERPKGV